MDELVLDGKTYVGSKKAAQECGYAQDYVGQLARKGFIDARRVSGQWYVQIDSLKAYKQKADTFKPEPPKYNPDPNVESSITVEGKEYVSAARAAKLAEYNQDYIAQLARAGKIPSKQVGNRWYVEPESLLRHKQEKDAMLRAVQAEAVGLKRPEPQVQVSHLIVQRVPMHKAEEPLMTYTKEEKPLFPEIAESVAMKAIPTRDEEPPVIGPISKIPIRVLRPITLEAREDGDVFQEDVQPSPVRIATPGKTMSRAIYWQVPVAVVLLLAVGLGAYKREAIYAAIQNTNNTNQTAATAGVSQEVRNIIDQLLTKEIVYMRE